MSLFSDRQGFTTTRAEIQRNVMDVALRYSLWNVLDLAIWTQDGFMYKQHGRPGIKAFARDLWFHYFKMPMDTIPEYSAPTLDIIRKHFMQGEWYVPYNFIEFVAEHGYGKNLPRLVNKVLETELSAYRLVDGHFVDITSEEELASVELAMQGDRFKGCSIHMKRAVELYSNRDQPDYRNSIKESMSAVESMARIVVGRQDATLSDALRVLNKENRLHPALKDGLTKLYAYTGDEGGVRHALNGDANPGAPEARYFLVSCSALIGYLKSLLPG